MIEIRIAMTARRHTKAKSFIPVLFAGSGAFIIPTDTDRAREMALFMAADTKTRA